MVKTMPKERYKIFKDITTNEELIVDMVTNEHLNLKESCGLLNKQDTELKRLTNLITLQCNKCGSNDIIHTVTFDGETKESQAKITCNNCGNTIVTWR